MDLLFRRDDFGHCGIDPFEHRVGRSSIGAVLMLLVIVSCVVDRQELRGMGRDQANRKPGAVFIAVDVLDNPLRIRFALRLFELRQQSRGR